MTGKEDKASSSLKTVNLIGCPAQLYEFHEDVEESNRFGLSLWLRPIAPRTIMIAAKDLDSAVRYLAAYMPDFQIRTVTPRGAVFTVMERL
jgi:hypothetical protein